MDFIRKNWSRLSLAFLYLIGGVIAVVAWVNNWDFITGSEGVAKFFYISVFISTIMFFFGMVCVTLFKALVNSKKAVSAVYVVFGSIITILLMVFIIVASSQQYEMVLFTGASAVDSFYMLWVPFIVFGLYPLIKGATRFIEASNVPVKAEVAQPVVEAEAPKAAPAKKTASKAKAKTTKEAK